MDPTTHLEDQVIYQATKDIFTGQKAKYRKSGPVKKTINSHLCKGSQIRQLVTQHGLDAVHQPVLKLLSERVYESASIASQRFPDLFQPSIAQDAARTILEAEATRSEQATLEGIIHPQWPGSHGTLDWAAAFQDDSDDTAYNQVGMPSLFPVYLPFPTEHLLMEKLQKVLELACYEFGVKALPKIMQKRGWECPESVELSKWVEVLGRDGNLEWESKDKSLKELLRSIAAIRHTAVHRLQTNSTGLERFLANAEDLAGILGNTVYTETISQLRSEAQSIFTELVRNKQFIQLQLEKGQKAIAEQRAKLDLKEQEILRHMAAEDERHRTLAGQRLEKTIDLLGDLRGEPSSEDAVSNCADYTETFIVSDHDSEFDFTDEFEECEMDDDLYYV